MQLEPIMTKKHSYLLIMMSISSPIQEQNTAGASEMELDRLKVECERSAQLVQKWKNLYQELQSLYASELIDGSTDE